MPLVGERGHDRQRAAGADEQRPHAEHLLERVEAELDRGRVGRNERRRRARPTAIVDVGARAARRRA